MVGHRNTVRAQPAVLDAEPTGGSGNSGDLRSGIRVRCDVDHHHTPAVVPAVGQLAVLDHQRARFGPLSERHQSTADRVVAGILGLCRGGGVCLETQRDTDSSREQGEYATGEHEPPGPRCTTQPTLRYRS